MGAYLPVRDPLADAHGYASRSWLGLLRSLSPTPPPDVLRQPIVTETRRMSRPWLLYCQSVATASGAYLPEPGDLVGADGRCAPSWVHFFQAAAG